MESFFLIISNKHLHRQYTVQDPCLELICESVNLNCESDYFVGAFVGESDGDSLKNMLGTVLGMLLGRALGVLLG
jgi:hypothetical protein